MSNDVFQVGNGSPANFSDGLIEVSVNGQVRNARAQAGTQTIGQFLSQQAQYYGVRTFSAYADGNKLYTSDSAKPASSFKKVDIVAKDARGLDGWVD